jgi:hypothetical protein
MIQSIKPVVGQIALDLAELNSGIYLVKLKINNVTSIHKVVKK